MGNAYEDYVSFELQEEILALEELRKDERFFSGRRHGLTAGELLRGKDGDPAALDRLVEILDLRPSSATSFGPSPTARTGSS